MLHGDTIIDSATTSTTQIKNPLNKDVNNLMQALGMILNSTDGLMNELPEKEKRLLSIKMEKQKKELSEKLQELIKSTSKI